MKRTDGGVRAQPKSPPRWRWPGGQLSSIPEEDDTVINMPRHRLATSWYRRWLVVPTGLTDRISAARNEGSRIKVLE
ncbi:hypothetical protein [Dyella terrae]|uniref:hypothetical protein n=1 Tax=Dyella terrae TaxID=522259 RepID=UPI001EFE895C|nr:hypothetical protein [Dyella terrae]